MNYQLIIHHIVKDDIQQALDWYNEKRFNLGYEYLLCVEACLENIKKNPTIYPIIYKNIRRALIRRFPYGIFFTIENSDINILAILHTHRSPELWKIRI